MIISESKETEVQYNDFNNILWMPPVTNTKNKLITIQYEKGMLKLDNYSIQVNNYEVEEYIGYLKKIAISIAPNYSLQFIGKYVDKEIIWICKNEVKSPPLEIRKIISNVAKKVIDSFWIVAMSVAVFYTAFALTVFYDDVRKDVSGVLYAVFGGLLSSYFISTAFITMRRFLFWSKTIKVPEVFGCFAFLIGFLLGAPIAIVVFLVIPLVLFYAWFGGGIYLLITYYKLKKDHGFGQLPSHKLTYIATI